jgi:hypothetical protein
MASVSMAAFSVAVTILSGCADFGRRASPGMTPDELARCSAAPGSNRWARTELYFGLSKPDGSLISEADFQRFLDAEVTPRFRNGFSVLSSRGQFLSETGDLVKESSRVIVLLYPFETRTSAAAEEIRTAYRSQFQQESVMRVDDAECVAF